MLKGTAVQPNGLPEFPHGQRATHILESSRQPTTEARPLVAFDESGNTGQNLLDRAQPVFALASVCLSEEDARKLAQLATMPGASEAKFSRLRTSGPGQKRLLEFIGSPLLCSDRAKISAYHKRFMITTKIVDMLMEEFHHRMGGPNLYHNRANLALANLWHTVMPVFCGPAEFLELQTRFVAMVRDGSPEAIRTFYEQVVRIRQVNRHPPFDLDLRMLELTQGIAQDVVVSGDRTALDPAIPTFVDLTSGWTADLNRPFDVVHDSSKPLATERERLELLMSTAHQPWVSPAGAPRRQFPLLSSGVAFVDSAKVPQVQVADVLAGAVAYFLAARSHGETDLLAEQLASSPLPELIRNGVLIWPDSTVDPAELGPSDDGASLDVIMRIAAAERQRRASATPAKGDAGS